MTDKFEGRYRGKWFRRQVWLSICSAPYKPDCPRCATGHYRTIWKMKVEHVIYKLVPWLWRKWANRKNSPSRKRLESIFPNLRNQ